jgi:hypothetical protein
MKFRASSALMLAVSLAASSSCMLDARGRLPAGDSPIRVGDALVLRSGAFTINLNLRDLSCRLIDARGGESIVISKAAFAPARYLLDEARSEIAYPELGLKAKAGIQAEAFFLEFSADRPQTIAWPRIPLKKNGTNLIWPYLEGNYVPLSEKTWTDFLRSREWSATQDLSMPFWGIERKGRTISYLFDDPFHDRITFRSNGDSMQLSLTHEFPDSPDRSRPIRFRVYLDEDASPIVPAAHFRAFLKARGGFASLDDKIRIAPLTARLIGAPQAYLWDGAPITIEDVEATGWRPLARAILGQASRPEPSAGKRIIASIPEGSAAFEAVARIAEPALDLKRGMARALSAALLSPELYDRRVWPPESLPAAERSIAERRAAGETLSDRDLVRLGGRLLRSSFPGWLRDPSGWGNGVSTRMIDALADSGMDRFALTCDGIEPLGLRPEVAAYAKAKGYLIGPYDSYFEVQDPEFPDWPTAAFDRALFDTGGIVRADGKTVAGFLGIGHYLNPIAAKPYLEKRVAENFRKAESSFYFLDCDACGEYFDDYRPGRALGASGDAVAKIDRIRAVFEGFRVPVASEGGFYLAAGCLSVAQGIFFPIIGFDDPECRQNEMSPYFLGRPLPPEQPEQFFAPASLKAADAALHSDPRFRLPLYEAVFHDSVITTSHYSSPSLKFPEIAETTALTEILYQVAPMYHFNLSYFAKVKDAIKPHVDLFKRTHSYSYRYALEEFRFLSDDRLVQRARFGDLVMTANFGTADFRSGDARVPARSVLVSFPDSGEVLIYREPGLARAAAALGGGSVALVATDLPGLIAALGDGEWNIREAAAQALAKKGTAAGPALTALETALEDEEWQVRRAAACALGNLGRAAKPALPALLVALGDEEWQVRRPAVFALGNLGRAARSALPALRLLLNDPEMQVRLAAMSALERIE